MFDLVLKIWVVTILLGVLVCITSYWALFQKLGKRMKISGFKLFTDMLIYDVKKLVIPLSGQLYLIKYTFPMIMSAIIMLISFITGGVPYLDTDNALRPFLEEYRKTGIWDPRAWYHKNQKENQ